MTEEVDNSTYVLHTIYPQGLMGKFVGPWAVCAVDLFSTRHDPEPRVIFKWIVSWAGTRESAERTMHYRKSKMRYSNTEYRVLEAPFMIWVRREQYFGSKNAERTRAVHVTLGRIVVSAQKLLASFPEPVSVAPVGHDEATAEYLQSALDDLKKLG